MTVRSQKELDEIRALCEFAWKESEEISRTIPPLMAAIATQSQGERLVEHVYVHDAEIPVRTKAAMLAAAAFIFHCGRLFDIDFNIDGSRGTVIPGKPSTL